MDTDGVRERFEALSAKRGESLDDDEMDKVMEEYGRVQDAIEQSGAWDLDRDLDLQQMPSFPSEYGQSTMRLWVPTDPAVDPSTCDETLDGSGLYLDEVTCDDGSGPQTYPFDAGLGLCRGLLALPDARRRLRLEDPARVALLARRFAPDLCAALGLLKDTEELESKSRDVFELLRDWISRQFGEIGFSDANQKAMDLLARGQ